MKLDPSQPSAIDYVLARMAPEVANTFTADQCQALEAALVPRRHPINIRLSVPYGWSRFYLVILAGTETRSAHRRQVEANRHPLWTPLNSLVIASVLGIGILTLLAVVNGNRVNFAKLSHPRVAPAGIPFKETRASCEQSGMVWQDGTCLDYGHNPTF